MRTAHGLPHVAQDPLCILVIPVVQDLTHQVAVAVPRLGHIACSSHTQP